MGSRLFGQSWMVKWCAALTVSWSGALSGNIGTTELRGRPLLSFETAHFYFQTERYIYKLDRKKLTKHVVRALEYAAFQNEMIQLNVPRQAIGFLWPVVQKVQEKNSAEAFSNAKVRWNNWELRGRMMLSFSDEFILVDAGSSIYQIRKRDLAPALKDHLEKIGTGDWVDMKVPTAALERSWNYGQKEPLRRFAAVQDQVRTEGERVVVTGAVQHSFDDTAVLIESKGAIYEIAKAFVTVTTRITNRPGTQITLAIPYKAIRHVWPSTNVQVVAQMNR